MVTQICARECPVCGDADTRRMLGSVGSLYSRENYDICECTKCDHKFTDPTPTEADLGAIYSERYAYEAHSLVVRETRVRARRNAAYIATFPPVASVLEVGCMYGYILDELV